MKALTRRGHLVTLICSNYGALNEETVDGINVIRVGSRFTVYPYAIYRYLRYEIWKKYDLVIDCALQGIPFFTPLYVKKSPVIAIFFHLEKDIFLKELPLEMGKTRGLIVGRMAYMLENRLIPVLYKNILKITFSESTKRDMIASGFDGKIIVLQEGIDLSIYRNNNVENRCHFPLIVYLGRLKAYKGVQDAIKAFKLIVNEVPNAHFSIVGRGDYEKHLIRLTKILGLEGKVTFHGYVDEREKIRLLSKAHLLVYPSYREGWATPVLEANACGAPAVVSDAIGVKETVKHGETGFIYPAGDYKKMADYIKILLKDEELRNRMSANAIKWARSFNWSTVEDKFTLICDKIINSWKH
jgi:glycosyltransferase involved in cell wall biosynthesis